MNKEMGDGKIRKALYPRIPIDERCTVQCRNIMVADCRPLEGRFHMDDIVLLSMLSSRRFHVATGHTWLRVSPIQGLRQPRNFSDTPLQKVALGAFQGANGHELQNSVAY